jgi:hypothetical protein
MDIMDMVGIFHVRKIMEGGFVIMEQLHALVWRLVEDLALVTLHLC